MPDTERNIVYNRTIIFNNIRANVSEENEFIYNELVDIYKKQAFDAGLEWDGEWEEFIFDMARDIEREVDNYRADLITNEPTHSTPWDED